MKKLLLGLGGASLAIIPIAAMVSCSSTTPDTQTPNPNLNERQYDVKQQKGLTREATTHENVLDPKLNRNATAIVDQLFNGLTVAGLQRDFDLILTDFYEIYEFENNLVEIELERIKVKSISKNGGNIVAKLDVTYESESNDNEQMLTKEINWTVRPTVSSWAEIQQIKTLIKDASTNDSGIDISDLKEYFLGENDNDMDFDDYGVFDRIAKLNNDKDLNNLGGLVGYELKLSDIFDQLLPGQRNVTMDTTFFAPSASLNNTFIFPSETGSLDYELDLAVLASITEAQLLNYTTKEELGTIIKKSAPNTQNLNSVSGIEVERLGNLFRVTVNFTDTNKLSEVISINAGLVMSSTL
ncbi:MAG: hypothetical protein ACRDCJ_02150 [Metamycoplasmataceae bacterium]